jgi:hypothetical protein
VLKKYLRNKAIAWITKDLLNTITEDDVLRSDGKRGIICKDQVISREMQDQIQVEAEYIKQSIVFKLVLDDMRFLANQTMFEKSTKFDDVMFGKAQLYVIDILKKKVENLAK